LPSSHDLICNSLGEEVIMLEMMVVEGVVVVVVVVVVVTPCRSGTSHGPPLPLLLVIT